MNADSAEMTPLLRQQRSRLPQFRKEFLVQRMLQVRRSGSSAGSHASANHSFHQLNVPQPPADHEFVKLGEPFAYINPVAIAPFIPIERKDCLSSRIKSLALGRAVCELQLAHRAQRIKENIVQRRLTQPAFQKSMSFGR